MFEAVIPAGQLAEWEERYQVVSQRQEGADVAVRFISHRSGSGNWRVCQPGLEDVFLYTYQER